MDIDEIRIGQLLSKAHSLPLLPGVYLMKDAAGKIIYVGKAKLLKNRVTSYFVNLASHNRKTVRLVSHIADFDYICTDSESEAFVLENELIKLHKPHYNIDLKDDKSYPYIALTDEEYPRLKLLRSRREDKRRGQYFGPYTSSFAVREIIDTACRAFRLPTCSKKFSEGKVSGRPCLNYHMGRCDGYCTGRVKKEEYRAVINQVTTFLKSDYSSLISRLKEEMNEQAESLNFEKAALLRDRINALSHLREKQKIVGSENLDCDAYGVFSDDSGGAVAVLHIRGGRIFGMDWNLFGADVLIDADSIESYAADYCAKCETLPSQILFPKEFEREQGLFETVYKDKLKISYPSRGEKAALIELAAENAREKLMISRRLYEKSDAVLLLLAESLCLEVVPERIEAYDISNSGDEYITCGMICLIHGQFKKSEYRSFNIKREGQDDYGAMREALSRRFDRAASKDDKFALPDLILLDGGKNHVGVARQVMLEKGIELPVFGMVKDEFHKTRSLTDGEAEVSIAKNGEIFRFIYKIQDEVHRFAISRMDKRRRKGMVKSSLTAVSGIGEEKAKLLLSHFKTLAKVKVAGFEELCGIKGISKADARHIVEYFSDNNGKK